MSPKGLPGPDRWSIWCALHLNNSPLARGCLANFLFTPHEQSIHTYSAALCNGHITAPPAFYEVMSACVVFFWPRRSITLTQAARQNVVESRESRWEPFDHTGRRAADTRQQARFRPPKKNGSCYEDDLRCFEIVVQRSTRHIGWLSQAGTGKRSKRYVLKLVSGG